MFQFAGDHTFNDFYDGMVSVDHYESEESFGKKVAFVGHNKKIKKNVSIEHIADQTHHKSLAKKILS